MPIIINGEVVDDSLVRQEANMLRPRFEEMMQDMDPVAREIQLREWSRENVIERVLLRQEALKDPDPVPEEIIEQAVAGSMGYETEEEAGCQTPSREAELRKEELRKEAETRLRIDRLIGKVTGKLAPARNKEVVEFYKKNKQRFWIPEMIHVAHIVKNITEEVDENAALEEIKKAQEELNAGADFFELANKFSDCPGSGGDLGFFPRGEMVEEFEEVVFKLEPNQTSDIFRTVFGFHIARVLEKRPEGARPLAEVREQLEAELMRQKQERAIENFIDRVKAKADIQTVKETAAAETGGETEAEG